MWIDNASDIDILFYEPYADIIAEIAQNPEYKPLTIGVFGIWGAGKSTLLNLVEQKIPDGKKYKKNIANTDLIVSELKRCADEMASTDLSMQTIRELIQQQGTE